MSENNYILSGKGFFKNIKFIYDTENNKPIGTEIRWTDVLREAKSFNLKIAKRIILNNQLDAFIWNPFKEEPIRNKWKVVKRSDYSSFYDDTVHSVLEWMPIKVKMESYTDVKFLINDRKSLIKNNYYDENEAIEIAKKRNMSMIAELNKKIGN